MSYVLLFTIFIALLYITKYYLLTNNIKKSLQELEYMKQNPDENRILHFSYPNKEADALFFSLNEYILLTREREIHQRNTEKGFRQQIENISHDLRTPLTAILGYLELLDKQQLSLENLESIEIIEKRAKYLQRLIQNFYDLSRLQLQDYQLEPVTVDLNKFTKEILLIHFHEFESRGLTVKMILLNQPCIISVDRDALERIFANLLENILRYAQNKFIVTLYLTKETAILIFSNDCKPIKQEYLEHLFDRFFMAEPSHNTESTGLGLAVVRLLITAIGGKISAYMQDDMLHFQLTFPLSP